MRGSSRRSVAGASATTGLASAAVVGVTAGRGRRAGSMQATSSAAAAPRRGPRRGRGPRARALRCAGHGRGSRKNLFIGCPCRSKGVGWSGGSIAALAALWAACGPARGRACGGALVLGREVDRGGHVGLEVGNFVLANFRLSIVISRPWTLIAAVRHPHEALEVMEEVREVEELAAELEGQRHLVEAGRVRRGGGARGAGRAGRARGGRAPCWTRRRSAVSAAWRPAAFWRDLTEALVFALAPGSVMGATAGQQPRGDRP